MTLKHKLLKYKWEYVISAFGTSLRKHSQVACTVDITLNNVCTVRMYNTSNCISLLIPTNTCRRKYWNRSTTVTAHQKKTAALASVIFIVAPCIS